MINPQIAKYITDERARGVTDPDIKKALLEKGWKVNDIENAFRAQAAIAHAHGLFKGRLDKENFLKIVLIGLLLQLIITGALGGNIAPGMSGYGIMGVGMIGIFVEGILSLIIGIYQLGAIARRLHDIGQTGWYALVLALISSIPYLGTVIGLGAIIYLSMTPGDLEGNSYGEVPEKNITLWQAIKGSK